MLLLDSLYGREGHWGFRAQGGIARALASRQLRTSVFHIAHPSAALQRSHASRHLVCIVQTDFPYFPSSLPLLMLPHHLGYIKPHFVCMNYHLFYHQIQMPPHMKTFLSIYSRNYLSILRFLYFLKHMLFCNIFLLLDFTQERSLKVRVTYPFLLYIHLSHTVVASSLNTVHMQSNSEGHKLQNKITFL